MREAKHLKKKKNDQSHGALAKGGLKVLYSLSQRGFWSLTSIVCNPQLMTFNYYFTQLGTVHGCWIMKSHKLEKIPRTQRDPCLLREQEYPRTQPYDKTADKQSPQNCQGALFWIPPHLPHTEK